MDDATINLGDDCPKTRHLVSWEAYTFKSLNYFNKLSLLNYQIDIQIILKHYIK
jgi:hypothetical protein